MAPVAASDVSRGERPVAIVTGGVRGIGRGISLRLLAGGWRVAVCYRSSLAEAQSLVAAAGDLGAEALSACCDVSKPEGVESFVAEVVQRWGRVDALINGVGPIRRVGLLEESPEGWRDMLAGNLDSVFLMARAVAPMMKAQGYGRIVSFGVANADHVMAAPQLAGYTIAKLGVLALTRSLARELGPYGVTANVVSPGFIDSGSAPLPEFESMIKRIPAGYMGAIEDVTGVVEFLLSDAARYVNGANIQVSGGWGL